MGAYGGGGYGQGPYGIGGAFTGTEGDVLSAYNLWVSSIKANKEIRVGRLRTFQSKRSISGGEINRGGFTMNLFARMSGRYFVTGDPELIEIITESGEFNSLD